MNVCAVNFSIMTFEESSFCGYVILFSTMKKCIYSWFIYGIMASNDRMVSEY